MNYSDLKFKKRRIKPDAAEFAALTQRADAFICAAGFEQRALRAPLAVKDVRSPILVAFKNGPAENDPSFRTLHSHFKGCPGLDVCELDWTHQEKFEKAIEHSLRQVRDFRSSEIIVDISGLPNFAICVTIAKIRHLFPLVRITLIYTEAEEYFPTKQDFDRIAKLAPKRGVELYPESLSANAVSTFVPAMFSGVTLGHNDTCLIIFVGYEPHRTSCAIETANPSKLVVVYGNPGRPDLRWRLDLSRIMHRKIDDQVIKAEETTSTSEIEDNLRLVMEYYDNLYDDHSIAVCPINSKIQAVAAALAWEIYPDIQLTFPVPVRYLPRRFSKEWRETFVVELDVALSARRFTNARVKSS